MRISDNSGKGEYIYGHEVGMIEVLSNTQNPKCIAIDIELHDGIDDVNVLEPYKEVEKTTSYVKLMEMVGRFMLQLKNRS